MENEIIYQDNLIEIKNDSIILKNYYFPSMKSKTVFFNSIEKIAVIKPSFFTGKWRIHGTGDFRTWYPFDRLRPKRDKIFRIYFKNGWIRSAFTVEDSEKVEEVLSIHIHLVK